MKRLVFISSLLLLLAACTRQEPVATMPEAPMHSELAAIDTLMQTQPDSALPALLPLAENDSLTPYDRHYADLLISEALFKNDYEQTTRSALLDALAYFDSLAAAQPQSNNFSYLSARTHYMDGVGLMETDSTVEACAEYLKALEIMENHFSKKELTGHKAKFMALTYNRLGNLFSDQLVTEQALACFKKSLHFSKIYPTSKYGLSKTLVTIGTHFNMLNQPDSALFYFEMARKSIVDTNNQVYRDILTSETILQYNYNGDTKAALNVLSRLKEMAENENERADRELVRGYAFYTEGMLDSAEVCFENVFNSEIDMLSKIQATKYLKEIYTKKGEAQKIYEYDKFLSPLALESYEQVHYDSQMIELFDNYQKQTLKNEHKKESASLRRKAILIFAVFALVVIPVIIFVQKRKHLRKMDNAKKEFEQEKQQNISLVNEIKASNTILKEENQRLSEDIKALNTKQKSSFKDYENLMKEPAIRDLLNRIKRLDIVTTNPSIAYDKHAITPKENRMLIEVFDKHCPNFSNRLTDLYPDLGKAETSFCKYLLLGLTVPQIAVLTKKDFSNAYRNERNIKAKMKCKDIHQHLKHLLFNISEGN